MTENLDIGYFSLGSGDVSAAGQRLSFLLDTAKVSEIRRMYDYLR